MNHRGEIVYDTGLVVFTNVVDGTVDIVGVKSEEYPFTSLHFLCVVCIQSKNFTNHKKYIQRVNN